MGKTKHWRTVKTTWRVLYQNQKPTKFSFELNHKFTEGFLFFCFYLFIYFFIYFFIFLLFILVLVFPLSFSPFLPLFHLSPPFILIFSFFLGHLPKTVIHLRHMMDLKATINVKYFADKVRFFKINI